MWLLVLLALIGVGAIAGKIFFERSKIKNLFEVSKDKVVEEVKEVEKKVSFWSKWF